MLVKDSRLVSDIQKEFNEKFPFLKIEFYKKPHKVGEGNVEKEHYSSDKILAEIRSKHNTGELSINGHLKVATLEKAFADQYGLRVQVFRKSGEIWLQTTSTDEWTLSEQNEHAKQFIASSTEK